MLSSRMRGAPASSASSISAVSRHSTSSGRSGNMLARRAHRRADAAGHRRVVLLDEDLVEQAEAVVAPAARGDRRLLERAQARRRLARVEDLRAGALDRAHARRGQRRDARQPPEEVQRRALGGEQRARAARRRAAPSPPSRHSPSGPSRSSSTSGSSARNTASARVEPEDDARRLLRDRRDGARAARAPSRRS